MSIFANANRLRSEEDKSIKSILFIIAVFIVFTDLIDAQVKNTENTQKLTENGTSEKATIADIEWIAGSWLGTGLGGVSEEMWTKPAGGIMIGTYRLMKENKPVFYEMMWLMEQEDTIIMRLKHFRPDLVGWEEKDKTGRFQVRQTRRKASLFQRPYVRGFCRK